ncbi:MAG: thioredoxin-dependent thiol peroxidase [Thermoanaerobaculales bacterium]|nr:thioredoxin-dependent thiol peroxidase [Thermoanaerobaculales bacterium]
MTASKIEVGKKAPAFKLQNQDETTISLSELRGKWVVLYFYPKDDTPGCTTEACEFTDGVADFEGLNAIVFGCSPDSPEKHREFIAKHKLGVDLLSDPDHKVMESYDAWGEKNMYGRVTVGVIRSTVMIDPEGRVAHHWKRVKAKGHAAKVKERLEQLQE